MKHQAGERRNVFAILAFVIAIVSVGFLLYPVAATAWNNVRQARVAQSYENSYEVDSPEVRGSVLEAARQYNTSVVGFPILDPWLNRASKNSGPYLDYLQQLNPQRAERPVIAALSIPTIDVHLPIYHGTDTTTLEHGLGHLYGSALPVGGTGTHSVITGHSGLANATLFDNLEDVKEHDPIYITVQGETLKYEVDAINVVLPEDTKLLAPDPNKDQITLITCTPYAVNSHRLLVRAHRVDLDPNDPNLTQTGTKIWQPWMLWTAALALAAITIIITLVLRRKKTTTHEK
ncbi:class C sortase SrtA [Corynebacterium diphtheriae]|uniref:class C sortase SrtA n=1 Tax=Corynebacterium diphtheriae TaxID=1717 RepID=UPI0002469054|nr:class C sortase [Corynebacterium diphtheriae]AEX81876.1 putative fimbrial associated sortase-like protein [Corynebacterium diphtheriae HC04]AEX81916.1 putative fimbrial associated sortase-like protein [Corynebacterium diphtheriae HC04]MBG9292200.1 class C sortase [Corynebacterium diphtheriae bv. gravis]MBG9373611.1 class C sortase [Corynebacterium diphtheriae bv. gravis]CAB0551962.1 class C sortase [Corynebacterium diphtheriae]